MTTPRRRPAPTFHPVTVADIDQLTLRDLTLPGGRGACWVGLEATAMRTVRRHLLGERGMDREQLYTRGYWKLGEADHPDHDTGED